jgi:osmotically-inducible protein OsmY
MRARVTARNRPEPLEDEELQQLITDRIEEDPVFWTGSGRRRTYVTVEVEDGHVMLSGVVRSPMDRRRADILARALGAVSVDNRLGVAEETTGKDKSKRSVA